MAVLCSHEVFIFSLNDLLSVKDQLRDVLFVDCIRNVYVDRKSLTLEEGLEVNSLFAVTNVLRNTFVMMICQFGFASAKTLELPLINIVKQLTGFKTVILKTCPEDPARFETQKDLSDAWLDADSDTGFMALVHVTRRALSQV